MLGRFGTDAGSLLGVEITSDSIRMLQLQRARGCRRVLAWALEPLVPAPGETGDPLVAALRRAHRRCGSRQRQVAVALPGSQVICKRCPMPAALPENEREAYLLAEAERLFPFPLEDLALDFQVIGPSPRQPGALDVLVGACRHSQFEPLLQQFDAAGLEVLAVEVDSLALHRALPMGTQTVLQLEADGMTVHAWPEGSVAWRREQRGGGLCLDSLERWLAGVGNWRQGPLLIAGAAASAQAAKAVVDRLGMACEVFQPLSGYDLRGVEDVTALSRAGSAFALACGLALGDGR
ncbi:pilus assembly protein PilM [Pseudomonas entomophila]|uniref:type IV pilus biogenesis protein PilM n=1 Tax=Pseudomonas entomophila TaxID=312306 RepID=UPI0023D7CF37|nr:pilus assembly protein PilM [Pseudomonas entomophila]MDF0734054.1 pilus assembly protein PilM [Pseudomonas entomophila]